MPSRSWQVLSGLGDPTALSWLEDSADPFLQPAFLAALESSGAVGSGTSWQPAHLLFSNHGRPAALLPLYRKSDSRGEYVFDHAWASAYGRHGLTYYPKLVTSIPFTPVPGPRLLLAGGESLTSWLPTVIQAVQEACIAQQCSGWHGLFVEDDWLPPAADAGLARREGCRFHWSNPGYRDFDDFLENLTSKKRKDIKRERRRIAEQGVQCRLLSGKEIGPDAWEFFYSCYERTYLEHGQHPYLNREFFEAIAAAMPHHLSLILAADRDGPMASALFFHGGHTLYGRYWGSLRRADGLHFEVCYYQGMELALRLGLRDFDPGTQGEHKLLRGFAPKATYSLHWLCEPAFQTAIGRFVSEESREMAAYRKAAEQALPYRQNHQA
jgi:predicted N-acyltransferase